jgi:hypothetical protein
LTNEIWRLDSNYLAAYTEDAEVIRKIRRSYPQFMIMAEYFKDGQCFALQYRVPSEKKRTIRRLLGVNVKVVRK